MVFPCVSVLENVVVSHMEMPEGKNVVKRLEKLMGKFLENSLENFLVSSMGNCVVTILRRT